MIDPNEAVQAFKEKFSKMSYSEREQYLKKMGFSFGDEFQAKKTPKSRYGRHGVVAKVTDVRIGTHTQSVAKKKTTGKTLVAAMAMKVKD